MRLKEEKNDSFFASFHSVFSSNFYSADIILAAREMNIMT